MAESKGTTVHSSSSAEPPKAGTWNPFQHLPPLMQATAGIMAATATLITSLVAAGVIRKPSQAPAVTLPPSPTAITSPAVTPSPTSTPPLTPTPSLTSAPLPTATPSLVSIPPPAAARGALVEDGFEKADGGWPVGGSEHYDMAYVDGEYRIAVFSANRDAWARYDKIGNLRDFILEVDARRVSGPLDNDFGVLVRYQVSTDDFYMLAISSDGFFQFLLHQNGEWRELVGWTKSSAIRGKEEVDRLRVICRGPRIQFFANGVLLKEIVDQTLQGGGVGLIAGAFDEGGVVVHFDNLVIWAIGE